MKNTNKIFPALLLVAALLCGVAAPSNAAEREPPMISAYYGSGSVIFYYGAEAIWTPGCECEWLTQNGLDPRWAVNVAYWKGHDEHPSSLWNAGAHGLLRWAPLKANAVSPFIELGTGIQLLSKTTINTNRYFGGAFQFGSRIGAGVAWGTDRRYELLTFLEHVSNASISEPNDGATYVAIQFRVGL